MLRTGAGESLHYTTSASIAIDNSAGRSKEKYEILFKLLLASVLGAW
jgi:hypothetical protein